MTEDSKKELNESAQQKPENSTAAPVAPTNQYDRLKPSMLLALIAIVLGSLALIEAAYLATQTKKFEHIMAANSKQVHELYNNQAQQVASFSGQLQTLQASLATAELKTSATTAAIKNLKQEKFIDNTSWKLAEIKYLLFLAQYNLQLTPAPETALAILEKVNNQLAEINDPNTLPLRQQVINSMAILKSLPVIDYAGILMQLNAVTKQLTTLPLIINTAQGTPQTFANPEETSGWRKYWHESLKTLEKLLIIRHQNTTAAPLITPKQQQFLEQNIQSKLSQASWGLLQRNQQVFELSLQSAIEWIQTYYSPNAKETQTVITTLQELQKINLQPQLPNLNQAIQLTENLLNSQQPSLKGVK